MHLVTCLNFQTGEKSREHSTARTGRKTSRKNSTFGMTKKMDRDQYGVQDLGATRGATVILAAEVVLAQEEVRLRDQEIFPRRKGIQLISAAYP